MSGCKELSPHVRIELVDQLMSNLYAGELKHQLNSLDSIITENSKQHMNEQTCFFYKEQYYKKQRQGKLERPVNSLHKQLRDQFKAWLAEKEDMEREKTRITAYFQNIFSITTYSEDLLRVLPPSLHRVVLKLDRHFLPGDGILQGAALEEFQQENKDLINILKGRMAFSLLDG